MVFGCSARADRTRSMESSVSYTLFTDNHAGRLKRGRRRVAASAVSFTK